jgi:hypothetical protein
LSHFHAILRLHYSITSSSLQTQAAEEDTVSALERSLLFSFSGPLLELLFPFGQQQLLYSHHSPATAVPAAEIKRDLLPVRHCCQSQILQLLYLILSHNTHTSHLSSISSSALPVLLSALLTDESLPSEIRYHSSQLLNLLLSSSSSSPSLSSLADAYDSLLIPLTEIFNSHSMDYLPQLEQMSPYSASLRHPQRSSLENIVSCIQSLRPPDSMIKSAGFIGSLVILTTLSQSGRYYLQTENHQEVSGTGTGTGGGEVCLPSCCCWKCFRCDWILRSLHDRRAVVRLMSLHIISSSITPSHLCCCSSHDLNPSSSSFHLYDSLSHLLLDTLECHAVRMTSLQLLTQICVMEHPPPPPSPSPPQDLSLLKPHYNLLLGSIAESLSPSPHSTSYSSPLLLTSLQSLQSLLCIPFFVSRDSFLGLLISLKIIPKIVNLLHPTAFLKLIESCEQRVLLHLPLHTSPSSNSNPNSSGDRSMLWSVTQSEIKSQARDFLRVKTFCLIILQRIHELGGVFFSSMIRNTNLIKNLLSILTSTSLFLPTQLSLNGICDAVTGQGQRHEEETTTLFLHSQVLSAACDLFSTLLIRDSTSATHGPHIATTAHPLGRFEMSQVIADKAVVTSTVSHNLQRILSNLDLLYEHMNRLSSSVASVARGKANHYLNLLENMLTAILRSLCLLCSHPEWRAGLGLGGPAEGCVASAPASDLYVSLLRLWKRSERSERSLLSEESANQLLFTLSCFLEASYGLKSLFHERLRANFEIETSLSQQMIQLFKKSSVSVIYSPSPTASKAATPDNMKKGPGQRQGRGLGGIQRIKQKGQELKSRQTNFTPPSPSLSSSSPWYSLPSPPLSLD